ncbi:MAG: trans-aconitate 2-methyltransferase [Pseudomonadota bacterium]
MRPNTSSTTDWQPDLYLRFERQRARPLHDLLSPLHDHSVGSVIDLGCGPGNSTEYLHKLYPGAELTGVDTSDAMLEQARRRVPSASFLQADAGTWMPEAPVDLVVANAVLHWLPDHQSLLPQLMGHLKPDGWLAIQMPDTLNEPTHRLMREVANRPYWADTLQEASGARTPIGSFADYHDWLGDTADTIEVWQTTYVHHLSGPDAIVDWMRGAGLTPYLKRLNVEQMTRFLDGYKAAIEMAYPMRADGSVLLEFPRVFILAQRRATQPAQSF